MNTFKKRTASAIIIAAALTLAMPAFAGWKRVGAYGGSDIYPTLDGCTTGGWVCSEVRIKKATKSVAEAATVSGERKAASTAPSVEKIYCTDGKGNYKSAGNGCGGVWKPVEMGSK